MVISTLTWKKVHKSPPPPPSTPHSLHQQYTAYGNGVRLCKRWAAAHLLSNHLSEEAIELVVARLFVCPAPCAVPGSAVCVLLRFLNLIAHFDWASEPLIVNLNHELKGASDVIGNHASKIMCGLLFQHQT